MTSDTSVVLVEDLSWAKPGRRWADQCWRVSRSGNKKKEQGVFLRFLALFEK